jgi:hypothetical protein
MGINLFGDPYNLQGSTPSLQGGNANLFLQVANPLAPAPAPASAPAPRLAQPVAPRPRTVAPAPVAPARPTAQPIQLNPLYSKYVATRPSPSNPGVLEYYRTDTNQALNQSDLFSFLSAVTNTNVNSFEQINGNPNGQVMTTGSPQVELDPMQQFAKAAGQAGLSLDDYLKLTSAQNGLSEEEKNAIRQGYGIDDLEKQVFSPPSKSTQQLYTDAYNSAGLADIKAKFNTLQDQINQKNDELNKRLSTIDENPWKSEATRIGAINREKTFFEGAINNLVNQASQVADLYNQGISEVNNLVTRQTADFDSNHTLTAQKLQYLLGKVDEQTKAAEAAKSGKAYRYVTDYLQSKAASQKPDTIGSNETGYYRWNPNTQTFEQIIAPKVEDKSLDNAYKMLQIQKLQQEIAGGGNANELLSASDAVALGVPYGTTKGQAAAMNITPTKPATDAQNQAAGYALRINQSGSILDQLQSAIQGYNAAGFEAQTRLPSYLQSGTIQSYDQAARNFINAQLRRESGAAISTQEFDNAYKQYLPRPGDSAQVLAQKKQNRDAVYKSLVNSSGSAYNTLTGSNGSSGGGSATDPLGLREKGGGVAAAISQKYPDGSTGGQCGDFAHQLVRFPPVGDSKTQKFATVDKIGIHAAEWRQDVRVGDVIITGENPTYGHVAVVNAILPNGQIQVSESNFKQSNKVSNDRTISINSPKIYGAIRGTLKIG